MLGTIVNSVAIIIGGFIGFFLKKGISEKVNNTVLASMGLFVILIGLKGAIKVDNILLMIFSLALGGIIGELIDIEMRLERFGKKIEKMMKKSEGGIAKGFVTTTLIYCVGAMAIVGSIESGLTGNHATLYAKAAIDGITAVIFASSLGIGVALSSVSVFIYQGTITLLAVFVKDIFLAAAINEISAIGGLLIAAIGFNILGVTKIKVGNLLPAIFLTMIYFVVRYYMA